MMIHENKKLIEMVYSKFNFNIVFFQNPKKCTTPMMKNKNYIKKM